MRDPRDYDPSDVRVLMASPVTMALCLGAAVVTLAGRKGLVDLAPFAISARVFTDRPWLAITTILPHLGVLHLLFNCYWTWRIGTLLEWTYGPWRYLALVLLTAIPSSAAQFVFDGPGVGLSGVVYGLWAAWFVLDKRNSTLRATLDPRVTQMFVIWFLVCVAASWAGTFAVGNTAHGVGALAGWLLTRAATADRSRRWVDAGLYLAVLVVTYGAGLLG